VLVKTFVRLQATLGNRWEGRGEFEKQTPTTPNLRFGRIVSSQRKNAGAVRDKAAKSPISPAEL
jgi:hypothetical protein